MYQNKYTNRPQPIFLSESESQKQARVCNQSPLLFDNVLHNYNRIIVPYQQDIFLRDLKTLGCAMAHLPFGYLSLMGAQPHIESMA